MASRENFLSKLKRVIYEKWTCNRIEDYTSLQVFGKESGTVIYTVAAGSLPSHIRSISMATTRSSLNSFGPLHNGKKPFIYAKGIILLIVTAVFLTSLILTLFFSGILGERAENKYTEKRKMLTSLRHDKPSAPQSSNVSQGIIHEHADDKPRCLKTCHSYSDPRFRSKCILGYCVCRGSGYQYQNCLPIAEGCTIQKNNQIAIMAFYSGTVEDLYSCVSRTNENQIPVHVISINGNHFAPETIVNIQGFEERPIKLVLANNYRIKWKVIVRGTTEITSVFLVSASLFSESTVEFDNLLRLPSIQRLYTDTGYGNDRHGGHTVDLISKLTPILGPIKSFTGSAYADRLEITLPL